MSFSKALLLTSSLQMPHPPSRNPTAMPRLPLPESCSSTARQVGTMSPSRSQFAMSFFPFKSHALRPSLSAVTTIPSASLTSISGTEGRSATWISCTSQAPILQLCRSLYCFFQFVLLPSALFTKVLSSSHLLLLEAKCNASSCFINEAVLSPGIRSARGSTNRL